MLAQRIYGLEEGETRKSLRQPSDYLTHYATKFDTIEVDSTFYGTPPSKMVQSWYSRTPAGFMFAAKVPQIITHEKMLHDCDAEMNEFLKVMDEPREKLGPLLLQFGFFDRSVFPSVEDFLVKLLPFLDKLPKDHKFVVEIQNKTWLVPKFIDALRERGLTDRVVKLETPPRVALMVDVPVPKPVALPVLLIDATNVA